MRTALVFTNELPPKYDEYIAALETGEWFYAGFNFGEMANYIFVSPQA